MSNPTTEKFYQLIRRNRGSIGSQTTSLIVNGNEIYSPDDQRNVFAKYYEELSVPKDVIVRLSLLRKTILIPEYLAFMCVCVFVDGCISQF